MQVIGRDEAGMSLTARTRRRGWRRLALVAASAPILLLATGYSARLPQILPAALQQGTSAQARAAEVTAAVPKVALTTRLMPISREEAVRFNESRGTDLAHVVAAKPFAVRGEFRADPRFLSALDCMTQAVYYEAGFEPDAGQRAVAQVVLNRVRHPAFPDSVCGVIYQGSELPTGCQFTFTCDGSLLRPPSVAAWARARRVALAALSGWVEESVGLSTHYHATYVVPYWASSLDKVNLIGQHIFYAFRGRGGSAAAFREGYDFSGEQAPALAALQMQPLEPLGEIATSRETISSLPLGIAPANSAVPSGLPLEADRAGPIATEQPVLRADQERGVLTVRGDNSTLIVD